MVLLTCDRAYMDRREMLLLLSHHVIKGYFLSFCRLAETRAFFLVIFERNLFVPPVSCTEFRIPPLVA